MRKFGITTVDRNPFSRDLRTLSLGSQAKHRGPQWLRSLVRKAADPLCDNRNTDLG